MHRSRAGLLLAAGLLGAAPGAPASAAAGERLDGRPATRVLGLGVEEAGAGLRIRVLTDGAIRKVDVFALRSPDRLVIDLFGLRDAATPSRVALDTAHFLQMRVGRHPEKIRIVVDGGPSSLPWEPLTTQRQPDGLVIGIGIERTGQIDLDSLEHLPVPAAAARPIPEARAEPNATGDPGALRVELEATRRRLDRGLPRSMRDSRKWTSSGDGEARGLATLDSWEPNAVAHDRIRLRLLEDRVRLTTRYGRSRSDVVAIRPAARADLDPGSLDRLLRSPGGVGDAFSQRLDLSLWRSGSARIDGFGSYQRVDPLFEWSDTGEKDPFAKAGRRVLETGGALRAGSVALALSRVSEQVDDGDPRIDHAAARRSYRALVSVSTEPFSAWLGASRGSADAAGPRQQAAETRDLSLGVAWEGAASSATLSLWRSRYERSGAGFDWSSSGADLAYGLDRELWSAYAGLGAQRDRGDAPDYHSVESRFDGYVSLLLRPQGLPPLEGTLSASRYQGDYDDLAEPFRTESLGFQVGIDLSDCLFPLQGPHPHFKVGYRASWSRTREGVADEPVEIDHGPMLGLAIDF